MISLYLVINLLLLIRRNELGEVKMGKDELIFTIAKTEN